jgi:hypothetical protein
MRTDDFHFVLDPSFHLCHKGSRILAIWQEDWADRDGDQARFLDEGFPWPDITGVHGDGKHRTVGGNGKTRSARFKA